MARIAVAFRTFWSLAAPYFRSEDRVRGWALAIGVIALEIGLVYVAVEINRWNGRFFNALEAHSWSAITDELVIFGAIFVGAIGTGYGQYWFGQHFQMHWRRWMTERFVARWMAGARHYRIRFVDNTVDNVHLRIVNDISVFIQKTHEIGSSLVGTLVYLVSFTVILWVISASTPMPLFGHDFSFPGWLIVVAFCYACVGTTVAHFVGRRLIALNFNQQRREADLRFATARVTDRSEQVALAHAEAVERTHIGRCIDALIVNWTALASAQSNLTGFIYGYLQSSVVFPMLVVTPAYLTGHITLGVLMQAALAFQKVESCFSFMVSTYGKFAEWKASMDRLWQLEVALQRVDDPAPSAARIVREPRPDMSLAGVVLRLPSDEPIAAVPNVTLAPGDRLLVKGPSGAGKSVLFRLLAGIWPFGSGTIELPRGARIMTLSSRPYFPLGSLRTALAMPASVDAVDDGTIRAAMAAAGVGDLVDRLDVEDEWSTALSGGQQQRLGFARVLIHRPDVLLLDDAVSTLEGHEMRELYRLVGERLPSMIVISSGRNAGLADLHQFTVDLGGPAKSRPAASSRAHLELVGPAAAPAVG